MAWWGALLPFMARRLGTDPATLSSPLITSVMDLAGVFVYFSLAYAFLGEHAAIAQFVFFKGKTRCVP